MTLQENNRSNCLFISTISPTNNSITNGLTQLSRANYNSVLRFCNIDTIHSLEGPSSFFYKLLRLFRAFFGDLAGNSYYFRNKLKKQLNLKKYDFIFIDHSQLGNLAQLFKINSSQSKIIAHFHNIESEYITNSMALPFFLKHIIKKAAYKNENALIKVANLIICLTQEDSNKLKDIYGRPADYVIPITTQSNRTVEYNQSNEMNKTQTFRTIAIQNLNLPESYLLFCGSYFKPNIEALQWFVENVIDSIALPLVVIGYQMENLKTQLSHQYLIILGTVDDTAPYYHYAKAVINPVFQGAGMNSKSVEAIGYGKFLFATSFALRGFPRPLPEGICICDSKNEFIQNLNNFSSSKTPQNDLISYHKNNFSLETRIKIFSSIFNKII